MTHTPGDWTVERSSVSSGYVKEKGIADFQIVGADPDRFVVAVVITDLSPALMDGAANANLLAAAPSLLGSLQEMLDIYWGEEGDGGSPPQCIVRARTAIEKAMAGSIEEPTG